MAKADGSYPKIMRNLVRSRVLFLDHLGVAAMSAQEKRDFLEVVEDRHGLASTIVAAKMPIENRHDNIRHPSIANAVLDRLVHNA